MEHLIYTGRKDTLEKIAKNGIRALNPKSMRYKRIGKKAKFEIKQTSNNLFGLFSDTDLKKIAESEGLII